MKLWFALCAVVLLLAGCATDTGTTESRSTAPPPPPAPVTPADARAIVKDAYVYGFPIVDNYRVQYSYFVDQEDPEYRGVWNDVHSTARLFTPADTAIQTPNSDTPYSIWAPTCAPNRWC